MLMLLFFIILFLAIFLSLYIWLREEVPCETQRAIKDAPHIHFIVITHNILMFLIGILCLVGIFGVEGKVDEDRRTHPLIAQETGNYMEVSSEHEGRVLFALMDLESGVKLSSFYLGSAHYAPENISFRESDEVKVEVIEKEKYNQHKFFKCLNKDMKSATMKREYEYVFYMPKEQISHVLKEIKKFL